MLILQQPPGSLYRPSGVTFDGSTDYYTQASSGTLANGTQLTVSAWFQLASAVGGTSKRILGHVNGGSANYVDMQPGQVLSARFLDTAGSACLEFTTTTTYADSTWHHVVFSVDMTDTGKRHLYIDDAVPSFTWNNYNNSSIELTPDSSWGFGASPTGVLFFDGEIAEIFIEDQYIDLSVTANRRKFISSTGLPVSMGTNGAAVFGGNAGFHLSGFADFNGDLSINGTPSEFTGLIKL